MLGENTRCLLFRKRELYRATQCDPISDRKTNRQDQLHTLARKKKKIGQEKIKICLVLFLGEESKLILVFISEALADAAIWILFPSRHIACFPCWKAICPQSWGKGDSLPCAVEEETEAQLRE